MIPALARKVVAAVRATWAHRCTLSTFTLGELLGRRWAARCSCGWVATAPSCGQALAGLGRHALRDDDGGGDGTGHPSGGGQ